MVDSDDPDFFNKGDFEANADEDVTITQISPIQHFRVNQNKKATTSRLSQGSNGLNTGVDPFGNPTNEFTTQTQGAAKLSGGSQNRLLLVSSPKQLAARKKQSSFNL